MSSKIKRVVFDFVASDYASKARKVEILAVNPDTSADRKKSDYREWKKGKQFTQRWFLSLQGEATPHISKTPNSANFATEQIILHTIHIGA